MRCEGLILYLLFGHIKNMEFLELQPILKNLDQISRAWDENRKICTVNIYISLNLG
jgi:hypothetical protein